MAGAVNSLLENKSFEEENVEVKDTPDTVADPNKPFYDRVWPVIACGAGLFSDGYLNGVCLELRLISSITS